MDDDEFSDDGFDDLNANILLELENNAIQFTQAKKIEATQDDYEYDKDIEDDDLDDAVVTNELRGKSTLLSGQPSVASSSRIIPQQPPQQHGWGSVPIPASHFRPKAVGLVARPPAQVQMGSRPPQLSPSFSQMRPPPLPRPTPTIQSRYEPSQGRRHGVSTNSEYDAMQTYIRDLEARLEAKDGEVGIVRSRLEKFREDHERELQTLKKQTAEQLVRQERAVEAAKIAQQTATTELEFTKRDLKDELDRARRRDGGTPKKNTATKTWGVSDGFEDVEMAGSPSKGNRGKNPGAVASVVPEPSARLTRTPTKGKRKRPTVMDSPVMALETTEDVMMDDAGIEPVVSSIGQRPTFSDVSRKPLSFDFLKVLLNHSSAKGRPMTFDYLAGFALPSKPTDSITSILFQKLAVTGDSSDPFRLSIEFCEQVIQLWSQCHKEGCLEPIGELVSLVSFTLQLNTIAIAPYVAEALVSVAMDSCYEVGIPRHHRTAPGDPTDQVFQNFKKNIPTSEILSVVYLAALGCATSSPIRGALTSPIVDFWSSVHPEFVIMMIQANRQPVDDFITILKLLCTSAFEDTIGPYSSKKTVDEVAPLIIERLSFHLIETERWDVGHEKLGTIRRTLLRTLAAFAMSAFGMRQLATHDYAIPRLVIFLASCIDQLYDGETTTKSYVFPPLDSSSPPGQEADAPGAVSPGVAQQADDQQTLIAHTMLLLHTIVTDKANKGIVNVSGKLSKFAGGPQKYLLSLARLNFAEEGVSEETAELAHELLELAVTEDEGAELGQFFGG